MPFLTAASFAWTLAFPEDRLLVEGQRLEKGIGAKPEAIELIEVIDEAALKARASSELADALELLPGISRQREGNEDRFVQIRGVRPSLNNVTVNGLRLAIGERVNGGRQTPLDLFSSRLIERVEVVKVQTPDMDGQGIGGTINLVTRSALPQGGDHGTHLGFELSTGLTEGSDDPQYRGSGMLELTNASGSLGLQLSGTYAESTDEREVREQGRWVDREDARVPRRLRLFDQDREEERFSGTLSLAWQPHDHHRFEISATGADLSEDDSLWRTESFFESVTPATARSGTLTSSTALRIEKEGADRKLYLLSFGAEHRFGDWEVDWQASWDEATYDTSLRRWDLEAAAIQESSYAIDGDGRLSLGPAAYAGLDDPFGVAEQRREWATLEDTAQTLGVDIARQIGALRLSAGALYRQADREFDEEKAIFVAAAPAAMTIPFGMTHPPGGSGPVPALSTHQLDQALGGEEYVPNALQSLIDSTIRDYRLSEDVTAVYLMGEHRRGALGIVGGLRVEQTSVSAEGPFLSFIGTGDVETTDDYTTALPMIGLSWQPLSSLQVRAAVGRRLGRPDFDLIAPYAGLTLDGTEGYLDHGNPDLEARLSSNYDLSATYRASDSLLVTIALFRKEIENEILPDVTVVEEGEIVDYLADFGLPPLPQAEGLTRLTVSRPVNMDEYTLEGIELFTRFRFAQAPAPFDRFLLTASLAATEEDGEVERNGEVVSTRLPEQTNFSSGLSLSYIHNRFAAHMDWSHGGEYISLLAETREEDRSQAEMEQLDIRLSYQMSDRIALTLDARNLTDPLAVTYQGRDEWQLRSTERFGRSVFLGLQGQF